MENNKVVISNQLSLTGHLLRISFILLFWMTAVFAYGQVKNVKGQVFDTKGESVIGASVLVKGTTNGTITDMDGNFILSNVSDDAILQVSFVGYVTQDVPVAGKSEIKVTLSEDTETLDEVVVIGYGSVKKSTLTGAVSKGGFYQFHFLFLA